MPKYSESTALEVLRDYQYAMAYHSAKGEFLIRVSEDARVLMRCLEGLGAFGMWDGPNHVITLYDERATLLGQKLAAAGFNFKGKDDLPSLEAGR